jgi:hypothetical protein
MLPANSVGYIGCSNSTTSVSGYHQITGNKNCLWPAYFTDGASIDRWADPGSLYWANYEGMIATYGQPELVWVQLCENYSSSPVTYSQVLSMINNLKTISPNAKIYVSAINSYSPITLCSLMGPNGQGVTDTVSWRDKLVCSGLALRGPGLGPLTADNTISDHCHPNDRGILLLGNQLKQFFDTF